MDYTPKKGDYAEVEGVPVDGEYITPNNQKLIFNKGYLVDTLPFVAFKSTLKMEKLEFKHIAKYLPNGLKAHCAGLYVSDELEKAIPIIVEVEGANKDYVEIHEIGRTVTEEYCYEDLFPILRTPDLTKPITHKGETFVPLVKLAEIAYPIDLWELAEKRKSVLSDRRKFEFDTLNNGFRCYNYQIDCLLIVPNQELLFEKLAEWMFDTRGLIKSGLAVDVETLDTNPYQ